MNQFPTSVTKLSYARGIGEFLQRNGAVQFASPDDLRYACDKVAGELMTTEPFVVRRDGSVHTNQLPADEVQKIAGTLVKMSEYLRSQGKTAADPSAVSLATPAAAYGDLLEKVAAAATVGMSTQKNDLSSAAAATNEAKQEAQKRPDGYALVGQGNTNFSESSDKRVGQEEPHPGQDVSEGMSSNSIVQATKAGSIKEVLQKLSAPMGATITGTDPSQQNKMEESPAGETMMEAQERPEGYALVGQGNANIKEPADAQVGTEQPHPKQPSDAEGVSTNSVVEATKSAEAGYIAEILIPHLPTNMSPEAKIATVQHCAGLPPALREHYVREVLTKAE
jgi:hypothetical protein